MKAIYSSIKSLIQENQSGVIGTVVTGEPELCPAGTKFVVNDQGIDLVGNFPTEFMTLLQEDIQTVKAGKTPTIVEKFYGNTIYKIFLDPFHSKTRLIVLGGGHIALPLVTIGQLLEFEVTVVDDRPAFASSERFTQAYEVICRDFPDAVRNMQFDQSTYVVIVTHGHRQDKICLAEVLKHKVQPGYTGMIGSKRKIKSLFDELLEEGFTPEHLEKVHTPIGLDIGAQTPQEIALSIMAEIITVKNYGKSSGNNPVMKTRPEGNGVG